MLTPDSTSHVHAQGGRAARTSEEAGDLHSRLAPRVVVAEAHGIPAWRGNWHASPRPAQSRRVQINMETSKPNPGYSVPQVPVPLIIEV